MADKLDAGVEFDDANTEFDDFEVSDEDINLDDIDLSSFGEVDVDIPYPHIKVPTKRLSEILRIAKMFTVASGRDVISKSIAIEGSGDKVDIRVTDFDSYLKISESLLNTENVLTDLVVVPIDFLQKVIKACPVNTVIYKDDEGLKIKVAGGDLPLETYGVTKDKFVCEGTIANLVGGINATQYLATFRAFTPIVLGAVTPGERRIVFTEGSAYASYMWAAIKSEGGYPPCEIKVKDLNILKALLVNREDEIQVGEVKDSKVKRTVFVSENFEYYSIASDVSISTKVVEILDKFDDVPGTFIDLVQLYKLIELASDLPYSLGKVGLNYSSEGLSLSIKTKKGKNIEFTLNGSFDGQCPALVNEVVIQAKLFRILLRSFSGASSVRISVQPEGIGVKTDNFQSACFNESN